MDGESERAAAAAGRTASPAASGIAPTGVVVRQPMRRASIVSGVLMVGFALVAADVIFSGRLTVLDREIALSIRDSGTDDSALASVMVGLTDLGSARGMALITLAGILYQLARRRWLLALAWASIPGLGALLNLGVKTVVQRDRPPLEWRNAAAPELSFSFPSGHAMGAAIGFGVVGYMGWLEFRRRSFRWLAVIVCGLLALGVGLSRVFLRAHWLSDVLAGFLIGAAWLAFCIGWVEMWRRAERS